MQSQQKAEKDCDRHVHWNPKPLEGDASAEELAADVESATRYAVASSTGYSLIYDDPDVVSLACAGAVDPLDCTAQNGAYTLEQDAAADEMPLDADTTLTSGTASTPSAAADVFTPSALADAVAAPDDFTAVDPALDTTNLALVGYFMRFSVLFNPIDSDSGDLWAHIGVIWIDPNRPPDTTVWRRKPSYAVWTALP